MARGEIITARAETIAAGGAALIRVEGKSVFADLTAPGDLACFRITEKHRDWARAEPVEILEPSPLRVEPVCPLYGSCGGCSLQHLNYEAQLSAKEGILREAFTRIGSLKAPQIRIHPSPILEYRNRVQFHCFPADRRRLGFKERKGPAIGPLRDCPAADPGIRRALGEGSLVPPPEKDRFTVYSRGGFFLSEGGKSRGRVSLGGRDLLMDAGVFFQSNGTMLEILLGDLTAAAKKADPGLPMVDLYCGVGTFAAFLGSRFLRTDLVEENKTALTLARENLEGSCRFFALSADRWVKSLKGKEDWGFMVADPPREGLSAPVRRYLAEKGPPLLAYVSCDPATLARDAGELTAGGYAVKELYLYDFYPQTAHIESLAVFGRAGTYSEN